MNGDLALAIVLSVACALAVGALVACEEAGSARGRWATKPVASLLFVAAAIALGATRSEYGTWILFGLILGGLGDVALLGASRRAFLVGLGLFLAGHVAYVVAFSTLAPPKTWLSPVAIVPVVFAAAIVAWLWRHLGADRPAVIAYALAIAVMLIAALAVIARGDVARYRAILVVGGAWLFAFSDVAVARDKFIAAGFINRAWGLPAYYAGQLFIAWSAFAP